MKILFLDNLELLIYDKNSKITNNKLLKDKIKDLDEEILIKELNEKICNSIITLPKILDGSVNTSKNLNIDEEFILPSFLINFDDLTLTGIYKYVNNLPSLIIKNKEEHFISIHLVDKKYKDKGWYFDDDEINTYLKSLYKLLEIKYTNPKDNENLNNLKKMKDNILLKKINDNFKNNKFGRIYTSDGLVIDKEKLFGIKFIDEIFDIKTTDSLNFLLKNLGDVGMAFNASLNGYYFSTTDNIAKIYFILFNFYKFIFNEYNLENFSFTDSNVNKIYGYLI